MKKILLTILLTCALALLAVPALAEVLNIVTIALPPYGYVKKDMPMGLNYEIGNAIATEAGYTPNNRIVPLARAMSEISNGTADITIMFPNPTIDEAADNLGQLLPMETVILGRADLPLRTLKDVRGKKLATIRGAKYDDRISKKNGMILYPTDGYSQSLKMLLAHRVDAVVGPRLGLLYTASEMSIPKHSLGKPLVLSVAEGTLFLSIRTATTEKRQRLLEARKRLMENGTILSLMEKYSL